MGKTVLTALINAVPDTVKITIASLVIAGLGIVYIKTFMIEEIKAHSDPIQQGNEIRFQTLIKHSDNQFNLLRDDIKEVKQQNNKILEKL